MSKDTPLLETQVETLASRQSETHISERVQASSGAGEATGSEQTGKREKLAPWHPIPMRLVDMVMPRLKDTELRVLLVVLRQTWGWKMDRGKVDRINIGKREAGDQENTRKQPTKHRDWISHRQLCRRTGRGSDAVSAAVASLTASGLVIVEDAGGKPLATPEERRRCLGRLYFRLGTLWLE